MRAHGALRAMFHEGRTDAAITLDRVLPAPDVYAVGALADLAGEVTIVGGNAYLSYPDGDGTRTEVTTRTAVGATLFVETSVAEWQSVSTKRPIRFEDLDEEVAGLAAAAGMRLDGRFPFLVEGEVEQLEWHVIDGRRLSGGGTSHADHAKAAVKTRLERASATLVGFFSKNDQGVFTHMGSETHVHCVLADPPATGHVDHVVIPAGTTVKFPAVAGAGRDTTDRLAR